jgi:serine protease AprX
MDLAESRRLHSGGRSGDTANSNSSGTGSLEGARGTAHLVDNGVVLNGAKDIFGDGVATATLAARRTAGTAWSGRMWSGNGWSSAGWS